uniref:Uncharacterized protein n=1 Tax=Seriola lalandi dorsalis TaxID=1841481 RepID=A0A3B4YF23_SERLL
PPYEAVDLHRNNAQNAAGLPKMLNESHILIAQSLCYTQGGVVMVTPCSLLPALLSFHFGKRQGPSLYQLCISQRYIIKETTEKNIFRHTGLYVQMTEEKVPSFSMKKVS